MEHIYVRTNLAKDPKLSVTKKIKKLIETEGMKCSLSAEGDSIEGADGIIVLGGDGTMLQVAGETLSTDIPILGINLGTMGYLTEVPLNKAKEAIVRLANEEYTVSERMMLEGNVIRGGEVIYSGYALNDIVLTRQGSLRIIHFETTVNEQDFNEYDADGLIIATPTGSTGYNMSAGGPIIEPNASVMVMTPICPHTFNSRSIVFSGEDEIGIHVNTDRTGNNQMVEVTFDAGHNLSLTTGDVINVKQASKVTKIVRLNEASFITALHQKMNS